MNQNTITILGEEMPQDMFLDFVQMISPTLKGYKFGCAPADFVCPICYSSNGGAIITTECNHMYHLDCLDQWMEIRNDCPTCRNVMPGCNRRMVEELLFKLQTRIKTNILHDWWNKIQHLTPEQLETVKNQMNDFVSNNGWNNVDFTATIRK